MPSLANELCKLTLWCFKHFDDYSWSCIWPGILCFIVCHVCPASVFTQSVTLSFSIEYSSNSNELWILFQPVLKYKYIWVRAIQLCHNFLTLIFHMTLDIGFSIPYFTFRLVSKTLFMIFFLNKQINFMPSYFVELFNFVIIFNLNLSCDLDFILLPEWCKKCKRYLYQLKLYSF